MRDGMLVYRDAGRAVNTMAELRRLRRLCEMGEDIERFLIEWTEFESAVVDAIAPEVDTWDHRLERLRGASREAARVWLAARDGVVDRRALDGAIALVDDLPLPGIVTLKVSEGYAFYALFPDTYAASARQFADEMDPCRVCVLGIRGIGCSLSAVAAAALERTACGIATFTVRPHGHPFARELRIDGRLAMAIRAEAEAGALFLIVDEGPGLSGSSFASVARALDELEVSSNRVVFLSSWDPAPDTLRSDDARRIWPAHRRYWNDAARSGVTPERLFGVAAPAHDWSAGRWRADTFATDDRWPAIRTEDERWKIAVPDERRVIKFVGLGAYGAAAKARAGTLHDLGLGPRPGPLRRGFLELAFVDGTPIETATDENDAALIGDYIGRVARRFPTAAAASNEDALALMVETNVRELTGYAAPSFAADVRKRVNVISGLPACEIDGRMLPHEWIRTSAGLTKVDALDHCRDHFFPGEQSAGWDLAAATVEFEMDDTSTSALVHAFERASGDAASAEHLMFYQLAYRAFRAGYLTLAAETADAAEASRLRRAAARHVARISIPSAL